MQNIYEPFIFRSLNHSTSNIYTLNLTFTWHIRR